MLKVFQLGQFCFLYFVDEVSVFQDLSQYFQALFSDL